MKLLVKSDCDDFRAIIRVNARRIMNDVTNIYAENGVVHKSMFSGNSCGHSGLAVLTGRVGLQGQETTFHEKRAYPFGVRELAPAFKASASRCTP